MLDGSQHCLSDCPASLYRRQLPKLALSQATTVARPSPPRSVLVDALLTVPYWRAGLPFAMIAATLRFLIERPVQRTRLAVPGNHTTTASAGRDSIDNHQGGGDGSRFLSASPLFPPQ